MLVTVITGYFPFIADVWKFDLATGAGAKLIENANGPTSQLVSAPAPGPYGATVSADGRYVYYAAVTPRAYGVRNGTSSRLMRFDRTTKQSEPVVTEGTNAMRPLRSPDGSMLVYGAESRGRSGLRVRRLSDGAERWLRLPVDRNALESHATRDMLSGYAFTPDGTTIIASYGGALHAIAKVRDVLVRAARDQLTKADFSFFRQTTFTRMQAFMARTLQGTAAPDRLDLYVLTPVGDDTEYVYLARYGARVFRVIASLAPDGGLTGVIARPEPQAARR